MTDPTTHTPESAIGPAPLPHVTGLRLSRKQSQQRTRQRVLDAATVLFLTDGYPATSIEAIGERTGYTYGAVLGHFRTKDALAVAVLEQVYRRAHARVHRYQVRDHDHVLTTVTTWMHIAITHPGWIRLEHALDAAGEYRDTQRRLCNIHSTATTFIANAFHETGMEPDVSPATAATMLLSIVIGHAAIDFDEATTSAGLRLLVDHVLAPADPQASTSADTAPATAVGCDTVTEFAASDGPCDRRVHT
ncbi:TetR/AcrR family transcriptional regulator [Nocardia sp. CA-107356]|uniref:TetR/AcrR family transcriptional regulator n=1 Tax=Nocardia sp. CA-107356 TaxID=3239972 RepID=UPI003D8BBDAC